MHACKQARMHLPAHKHTCTHSRAVTISRSSLTKCLVLKTDSPNHCKCVLQFKLGFLRLKNLRVQAKPSSGQSSSRLLSEKRRLCVVNMQRRLNECLYRKYYDSLSQKQKLKLAERGFDPRTSGLWAQHASTAPLCCTLTQSIATMGLLAHAL